MVPVGTNENKIGKHLGHLLKNYWLRHPVATKTGKQRTVKELLRSLVEPPAGEKKEFMERGCGKRVRGDLAIGRHAYNPESVLIGLRGDPTSPYKNK